MSKKKKQKSPRSGKAAKVMSFKDAGKALKDCPKDILTVMEDQFVEDFNDKLFPLVVARTTDAVMDVVMPALEKTFDDQNEFVQKLIAESLEKAYIHLLNYSVADREQAVKDLDGAAKEALLADEISEMVKEMEETGVRPDGTPYKKEADDGNES